MVQTCKDNLDSFNNFQMLIDHKKEYHTRYIQTHNDNERTLRIKEMRRKSVKVIINN